MDCVSKNVVSAALSFFALLPLASAIAFDETCSSALAAAPIESAGTNFRPEAVSQSKDETSSRSKSENAEPKKQNAETELKGEIKTSVSVSDLNNAHQHVKNRDYKRAYKQFKKLANKGCPYSQCIVGLMHHKGIGTKKNTKKAIYWYEKSAGQGWKDAEHRLGIIHLTGDGVAKNFQRGIQLLQSAAKHGALEAQLTLEKIEREGAETLVDVRNWVSSEANKDLNQAKALTGQVPNFAGSSPGAAPKTEYERGLMNIQKSWTGYADVVKNLESMQNASNR